MADPEDLTGNSEKSFFSVGFTSLRSEFGGGRILGWVELAGVVQGKEGKASRRGLREG